MVKEIVENFIKDYKITLFSQLTCPYSDRLKYDLNKSKIEYKCIEIDLFGKYISRFSYL